MMNSADEERFWSKVAIGGPDDCWEWTAGKDRCGYGGFKMGGRPFQSHRVSWELANGAIPDGILACHKCDNPGCVNPAHLFLGTNADNAADREAKGRGARGGNHYRSKLTDADVRKIRGLLKGGEIHREIAVRFGVSSSTIRHISTGYTWAWLAGD